MELREHLPHSIVQEILDQGFAIADPDYAPHESTKHGFLKVTREGEYYFAKYSRDNTVRESSIAIDIWWSGFMEKQRQAHPELALHTPRIVASAEDWYVSEWIDGEPSAKPTDSADALLAHLERYTGFLVALDRLNPSPDPNAPAARQNSTPYNKLDMRWETWAQPALSSVLLRSRDLEAAKTLLNDFTAAVKPQLQHGDFVPWHILVDKQNTAWLIDAEHANFLKPRFYDLAYMYSRIFTRLHSPQVASKLLERFCHERQVDYKKEVFPAILPVMTSRAIGMHFDALNDLYGGDYRPEAADLLKRCLSRDPKALLQG